MIPIMVIGLFLVVIFKGVWWSWLPWGSEIPLYLWFRWKGEKIVEVDSDNPYPD